MKKMTGADLNAMAAAQSAQMSPAHRNVAPLPTKVSVAGSRGGNRISMNGIDSSSKPPLSQAAHNQMTPDPKR